MQLQERSKGVTNHVTIILHIILKCCQFLSSSNYSLDYMFSKIVLLIIYFVSVSSLRSSVSPLTRQRGIVTVYHKETCPHCKKVIELLENDYSLSINKVNVLEGEDKNKKLQQMRTFSGGRNTVPQVFFNSHHLGGNDDVQEMHRGGKLDFLIDQHLSKEAFMSKGWYHPWY